MDRPSIRLTSVTVTTPRPRALAAFWSALLGWPVSAEEPAGEGEPEEAGWAQVRPPAGVAGFTLNLEHERSWTRPVWPSEPGHQFATEHLDLEVDDLDAAVAWALECGAELAAHQPQADVRVLFDPDGHPFCFF